MKSEFRSPAALADPLGFRWTFCFHPMYFMVFRASEVLRIRILDALLPLSYVSYGISCLGGAQTSNSGRIRVQFLGTLCKPTMTKERKARQDTEAWEERDMNKEKRYVDDKDEEEEEGEGAEEL